MDDATSSHQPETNNSIPVPAPSRSGLIPVDGVGIYYELFGSGYPLVLVPGVVADSRIWDDQVAAFAERYMVVRFDLRGSGRSESGTEPFTYVGDMASMLRTLQVDPAYLVGIAEGASLAVEYAVEYPHQVEALVLVNTTIRGYVPATMSPEALEQLNEVLSHVTGTTPEERLQQFVETSMSLPEFSHQRPEVRERLRTIATEFVQRMTANMVWMERTQQAWLKPPAFQRLSEIHVPTLIVVRGPPNSDAQQSVEAVSHAIAGAKVVLMPAESTMVNVEQQELLTGLSLTFSMRSTNHRSRDAASLRPCSTQQHTIVRYVAPFGTVSTLSGKQAFLNQAVDPNRSPRGIGKDNMRHFSQLQGCQGAASLICHKQSGNALPDGLAGYNHRQSRNLPVEVQPEKGDYSMSEIYGGRYFTGYKDPILPSQTDQSWLQFDNPAREETLEDDDGKTLTGKWDLYRSPEAIDTLWPRLKDSVQAGRLGTTMTASTPINPYRLPVNPGEEAGGVIRIYTRDWRDLDDIRRVLAELRTLGITDKLYYKADAQTLLSRREGVYCSPQETQLEFTATGIAWYHEKGIPVSGKLNAATGEIDSF